MPDLAQTGIADANGNITLVFRPTARQDWTVKQVSVNGAITGATAVGSGAQCNIFLDTSFIATLATPKDVAAGEPYVDLANGRNLYVRITGCVVGSAAQAVILYSEVVQPVG
jgi:hypothetical protein